MSRSRQQAETAVAATGWVARVTPEVFALELIRTIELIRILNHCHHHRGFVYRHTRFGSGKAGGQTMERRGEGGERPGDLRLEVAGRRDAPRDRRGFPERGCPLFPERHSDLKTECSRPDWSNPCEHIAAVYYLLGEEFDRDPFLLFKLRGMERGEFVALPGESPVRAESATAPEPLPASPAAFWVAGELPADMIGAAPLTPAGAALPRRLGKFPFWRGSGDLLEFLEPVYVQAPVRAAGTLERG